MNEANITVSGLPFKFRHHNERHQITSWRYSEGDLLIKLSLVKGVYRCAVYVMGVRVGLFTEGQSAAHALAEAKEQVHELVRKNSLTPCAR